jgi:hypothetical protein
MGSTKFYDPDQFQFLFAGIPVEGYAEGSMISVEFSEDRFKTVKGVDGVVTRSKVPGVMATITVHLMQTSRTNAVFTGIHTQDILSPGGAGVAPVMMRDGNGASVLASDEAWINGFPAIEYGDQGQPREWKITVISPKVVEAGT